MLSDKNESQQSKDDTVQLIFNRVNKNFNIKKKKKITVF